MANLYEEQYDMYDVGKRRYSDATADAPAPAPLPPRPISTTPKVGVQDAVGEKKWRSFIISMVLHGITIALLAAILTIILTTGQQTNTSTESTAQSSKIQAAPKNGTSCLDLANKGNNKDNIYKITPQATNVEEFQAKDIMVWHVPGDTTIAKIKQESTFQYRTNNSFLNARSLKGLFQEYPLKPSSDVLKLYEERPFSVIKELLQTKDTIIAQLPNFKTYTLQDTYIHNSVSVSRSSHKVTFKATDCEHKTVTYGTNYRCGNTIFNTSSHSTDLFFAIVAISNDDKSQNSFTIQIEVRKPATSTTYVPSTTPWLSGNVTQGAYILRYTIHELYHTGVTQGSIAQFYFVVTNEQEWKSDFRPRSFIVTDENTDTYTHEATFRVENNPVNTIMGYTLLTRAAGVKTNADQGRKVAELILNGVISVNNLYIETTGYSIPVIFGKGNKEQFLKTVPGDVKSGAEPGFVQFRAYNFHGYTNAFCPGIKVSTVMPQYLCIGGVSNDTLEKGTCGDFAGWEGKAGETPSTNDQAPGHAHSPNDLRSAILLFVR